MNHSWWAMIVLILVGASLYACLLFSYFFLWTVNPGVWPTEGAGLRAIGWPAVAAALYVGSSVFIAIAGQSLRDVPRRSAWPVRIMILLAIPLMLTALGLDILGHWQIGLRPTESSYGAVVYMIKALQGIYVAVVAVMGFYTVARSFAGMLDGVRRSTFDNTMLYWHWTTLQGVVGLVIVYAFPRLVG